MNAPQHAFVLPADKPLWPAGQASQPNVPPSCPKPVGFDNDQQQSVSATPCMRSHRSMLDDLNLLRSFVTVVDTGSFSRAGRLLNIVPSTVSKHIAALEARINGQLITRSTTQLSITELGERFHVRCLNILEEVGTAEEELETYQAEAQGTLRIAVTAMAARPLIAPAIRSFISKYPKVRVQLIFPSAKDGSGGRGIDLLLQTSDQLAPELIAVKLAPIMMIYCASPAYLAANGTPITPAELRQHNCLLVGDDSRSDSWPLIEPDGSESSITVAGTTACEDEEMLRYLTLSGIGIARIPHALVGAALAAGELVEIFPDSRKVDGLLFAAYAQRRNLALKTRTFLDHLKRELGYLQHLSTLS